MCDSNAKILRFLGFFWQSFGFLGFFKNFDRLGHPVAVLWLKFFALAIVFLLMFEV